MSAWARPHRSCSAVTARLRPRNGAAGRARRKGTWGGAFFAYPDKLCAEYAIAVRSYWKGHGLGYLLMTRLIDIARRHGVREFAGEVPRENQPTLPRAWFCGRPRTGRSCRHDGEQEVGGAPASAKDR